MSEIGPLDQDRVRDRRADASRRRVRRRRAAVLGLAGAALVVGLVLLIGGGGASHRAPAAKTAAVSAPPGRTVSSVQAHANWVPHKGPVPVLMYHVIDQPNPGAPFPDLFVDPPEFAAEVAWLDKHGYAAVTLDQVENAWWKGGRLPPKPIVLSFDDGYLGQYTHAMPLLRRLGWPGVLDLKATGSDLSDNEVAKMIAAGWELASHTISHLDLTTLGAAELTHEVSGSRQLLRKRFGVAVDNFCYPAGRYNAAVVAAVKAAGYRGATTVDPGLAASSEPFTLKRVRVDRGDGPGGLARKLAQYGG